MLKLLLDEHISPAVAAGLRRRSRVLQVSALVEWEGGAFLGQDDAACLRGAVRRGWTFVTYDRRTFPPLLRSWADAGEHHSGAIFVDERTISPSDIGGLVHALATLQKQSSGWDWTDRICFLRR